MTPAGLSPSESVKSELAALLDTDQGRIGDVQRLAKRRLTPPPVAAELRIASSGFVSNRGSIARALLQIHLPTGPSIARQVLGGVQSVTGSVYLTPDAANHVAELLNSSPLEAESGSVTP